MEFPHLLNIKHVEIFSRKSRSTIYRDVKSGDFPRPIKLSRNRVAWLKDELEDWLASRERGCQSHQSSSRHESPELKLTLPEYLRYLVDKHKLVPLPKDQRRFFVRDPSGFMQCKIFTRD